MTHSLLLYSLDNVTVIEDPCQAKNSKAMQLYQTREVELRGTGNIQQCMESLKPLLHADKQCSVDPCSINGVHQPPIPVKSTFYGISEYWYSTFDVLNLKGYYNPLTVSTAAQVGSHRSLFSLSNYVIPRIYHGSTN